MSGQNRLINSENTKKGGSYDELASKLNNANEIAEDEDVEMVEDDK